MLSNLLNRAYTDCGLLLLRVSFGLMLFIGHGLGKLQNFEKAFNTFADPIGMGPQISYLLTVGAEVFCALLVVIGLLTRLATIPLMIVFLVIYFIVMPQKGFFDKEIVVMFFVAFATIFFAGPGKYSVDHKWFKRS